jgi:hypothetical protein
MEPVYSIVAILGYFVLLAIDLGILFLVVRLVVRRRRVRILMRLDEVGRPFVAALTQEAERLHKILWPSTVLNEQWASVLALCGLGSLRLLLGGLLAQLR